MKVRIAGITPESVVDGPGLRLVVFTQGCPHNCHGCHNPQTHDPQGGNEMEVKEIMAVIEHTKLIRGVTFSGGEPFLQPGPLTYLAKRIHQLGLDVVAYSGFYFEQLVALGLGRQEIKDLLRNTDILIDGPYHAAERDTKLAFRGSRNQRLIDVQKSLQAGRVVEWEDPAVVSSVTINRATK